jgi:hypothetical protein
MFTSFIDFLLFFVMGISIFIIIKIITIIIPFIRRISNYNILLTDGLTGGLTWGLTVGIWILWKNRNCYQDSCLYKM